MIFSLSFYEISVLCFQYVSFYKLFLYLLIYLLIFQGLNERVKELAGQLQISDIKCADMKEDIERMKRELSKAENIEIELRKTSDYQSRTINEYQILREQVFI